LYLLKEETNKSLERGKKGKTGGSVVSWGAVLQGSIAPSECFLTRELRAMLRIGLNAQRKRLWQLRRVRKRGGRRDTADRLFTTRKVSSEVSSCDRGTYARRSGKKGSQQVFFSSPRLSSKRNMKGARTVMSNFWD